MEAPLRTAPCTDTTGVARSAEARVEGACRVRLGEGGPLNRRVRRPAPDSGRLVIARERVTDSSLNPTRNKNP